MQSLCPAPEDFGQLPEPIPTNSKFRPTPRESEVLQLICEGYTSKQIAARLGISFKTVVSHRARLLEKARVQSSIKLFRWALKNGLVSLEDLPHVTPARQTALTEGG
jgi:DNA-binding NarL/FixJ family response regulator